MANTLWDVDNAGSAETGCYGCTGNNSLSDKSTVKNQVQILTASVAYKHGH